MHSTRYFAFYPHICTSCYPLAQLTARLRFTFTALARYDTDNITVSNEAYINMNTMNDNEYDNDAMLTREYQRESRQREYIRLDARTMVLATIDELNQYLLGNVTLEAATDAARELTHKLNASW